MVFFWFTATVLCYCTLSVFALYKHGSGNSSFLVSWAPCGTVATVPRGTVATVYIFFNIYVNWYIYSYTDITNFTIFSQLLSCQFLTSRNKIGKKHILVPTFSDDSHFRPYILFLPLLVPILKNASRFGPYRYSFNRNSIHGKRSNSKW